MATKSGLKQVVTYGFAYAPGKISLCAEHATDEAAGAPLGSVDHGQHEGRCAACDPAEQDAAEDSAQVAAYEARR